VWWLAAVVAAAGVLVVGLFRARGGLDALTAALLGASGLALAGLLGAIDRNWLVRSQLPTDLAPAVGRTVVVASLVLGLGLAALAVMAILRPAPTPRAPTTAAPDRGSVATVG
jgi:hypothetical protein